MVVAIIKLSQSYASDMAIAHVSSRCVIDPYKTNHRVSDEIQLKKVNKWNWLSALF